MTVEHLPVTEVPLAFVCLRTPFLWLVSSHWAPPTAIFSYFRSTTHSRQDPHWLVFRTPEIQPTFSVKHAGYVSPRKEHACLHFHWWKHFWYHNHILSKSRRHEISYIKATQLFFHLLTSNDQHLAKEKRFLKITKNKKKEENQVTFYSSFLKLC